MRSQGISGAGRKRLFGVFRQKGALLHRKPLPSQHSCLVLPRGSVGGHRDGLKGLDVLEFVTGEVDEQLLGPALAGSDLKVDLGALLGLEGRHPVEEEQGDGSLLVGAERWA